MKKLLQLKTMLLLCALIVGSSSVWAASVDITPTQALNQGGVDPITIVCAKGDGTSNPAISSGQLRLYQAGSGKTTGNTMTFSSENTITSIVFTFSDDDKTADNGAFSEGTYDSKTYTWSGSTKSVTLTVTGTTSGKRIYITAMTVNYEDASDTWSVTYDANGATSGDVPTDDTEYDAENNSVTVLGNTGSLAKTGYTFNGWNTKADGSGTGYAEGASFEISSNTTLYAQWTVNSHSVTLPATDTYGSYTMSASNPVSYGTAVTLTYTPATGYEEYRASWSVNGSPIVGNAFNMPDENVEVTVSVEEVIDYATLPFAFNGGLSDIEDTEGLTQEGLGSYDSSLKLKFDSTGDYLILKINETPGILTFDIKGNSFSGGTFTVQASADGVNYSDVASYTPLNETTNEEIDDLASTVRYIKWIYTTKSSGNVALGNISLARPIPTHTLSTAVSPDEAGNVTLSATSIKEGATATATAEANAGYKFLSWSISGTGASLSSTTTNPTTVTMGTADATITANFEAVTTYAISYSVNGVTIDTKNIEEGAAIDLSAPESGIPSGYVFRGWSASEILTPQATEAGISYVTSATSSADITYYAVLAIGEKQDDTYEKLTSNSFDANATYLIGGKQSGDVNDIWYIESYANVDSNSDWGVATTDASEARTYTLSGTASALVVKDDLGNYLEGLSTAKFKMSSTSKTVYLNNDGSIKAASSGYNLRHNYNSGKGGFRWYNGSNEMNAYFFKVIEHYLYSNYCTTVPTATVSIASACTDGVKFYGTYSNSSAFIVPDGLTVSEINVLDGKLSLSNYDTGDVVPANTGVLVSSTTSGNHPVTLSTGGTSKLDGENMLRPSGDAGISAEDMTAADDGCYFYHLTMGDTCPGFWWKADNGVGFNLAANKAYLAVPKGVGVRSFDLFGDETVIVELNSHQSKINNFDSVYNLSGQRIVTPAKGLYIVNGKKYIVK